MYELASVHDAKSLFVRYFNKVVKHRLCFGRMAINIIVSWRGLFEKNSRAFGSLDECSTQPAALRQAGRSLIAVQHFLLVLNELLADGLNRHLSGSLKLVGIVGSKQRIARNVQLNFYRFPFFMFVTLRL